MLATLLPNEVRALWDYQRVPLVQNYQHYPLAQLML